jgi:hypothetical protein
MPNSIVLASFLLLVNSAIFLKQVNGHGVVKGIVAGNK